MIKILRKEYKYNELIYKGNYVNGKRNGYGEEYKYNELIYNGDHLNDKRNGFGMEYKTIYLNLNIKTKEKVEEDSDNDENIGVFDKIPEDQVNFDDFKYIYIRYRDFLFSGEFHNVIKLKEIYNFMRYIKKNFKMKIILNFGEKFKFNEKYIIKLLKIVDIHIFGSKNELLDILIKRKEKDILIRQKKKKIKKIYLKRY